MVDCVSYIIHSHAGNPSAAKNGRVKYFSLLCFHLAHPHLCCHRLGKLPQLVDQRLVPPTHSPTHSPTHPLNHSSTQPIPLRIRWLQVCEGLLNFPRGSCHVGDLQKAGWRWRSTWMPLQLQEEDHLCRARIAFRRGLLLHPIRWDWRD